MDIKDIKKVHLGHGDILVVKCPDYVGPRDRRRCYEDFEKLLSKMGVRAEIVVVDSNFDLQVISTPGGNGIDRAQKRSRSKLSR